MQSAPIIFLLPSGRHYSDINESHCLNSTFRGPGFESCLED